MIWFFTKGERVVEFCGECYTPKRSGIIARDQRFYGQVMVRWDGNSIARKALTHPSVLRRAKTPRDPHAHP